MGAAADATGSTGGGDGIGGVRANRPDSGAIARMFTGPDGRFRFARWGRPMAPVVFGTDDATLATLRSALATVARIAERPLAETDPESGANLMIFFLRDWAEMAAIPDLGALLGGNVPLPDDLARSGARRYRRFRFDAGGAGRAAVSLVRLDRDLDGIAAESLALDEAVRLSLTWSPAAFDGAPGVVLSGGRAVPGPGVSALIRAAYDRSLPDSGTDPSLALRIAARLPAAG